MKLIHLLQELLRQISLWPLMVNYDVTVRFDPGLGVYMYEHIAGIEVNADDETIIITLKEEG